MKLIRNDNLNIVINDRQRFLSDFAHRRAKSRVQSVFSRFSDRVKSVEITIQDVNGPRGGIDKQCQIIVRIRKSKDVVVTVSDDSLGRAIPNAIDRASRTVSRQIDRRMFKGGRAFPRMGFGS